MFSFPVQHQEALQATVHRLAVASGFAQAGIAPADAEHPASREYFEDWIDRGHAGEMEYLKRRNAAGELVRSSLVAAVPWARSVIVCAAPYGGGVPTSLDPAPPGTGWIARYAWSGARDACGELRPSDYHKVLLARLKQMERALHAELGPAQGHAEGWQSWAYVDTGPVIERAWAQAAGIGWTGKNACTLSQELGSFFFLGVILTSLEVRPEARATIAADRCGSCTRCIEACPTDALVAPRQMDASRCISYLTIEKRGAIPEELRAGMGRQVFGCDICQDVCPWNARHAQHGPVRIDGDFEPRRQLVNPPLAVLAGMSEEEFGRIFYGSPVKRAKFAGFRRNVAIAIGNSGEVALAPHLQAWTENADPVLAEAASWALRQLRAAPGRAIADPSLWSG